MNKLISKSYGLTRKLWNATDSYRNQLQLDNLMLRGIGKYNISNPKGRCLFSYITNYVSYLYKHSEVGVKGWDPVTLPAKMEKLASGFSSHQTHWESVEMVRQLIEKGYIVDCIFDRDAHLIKDVSGYDVIIDEWKNFPQWAESKPAPKKLFYATGSHWIFHNKAELTRHEWLFSRRGVSVPTVRQVPPLLDPAYANLISIFGNQSNRATFGLFSKKVRKIWKSSVNLPVKLEPKNWQGARSRFLYFGSSGWVHRGLDLVIEAFLEEPKLELVICGGDKGFLSVYGKEISRAGNIVYQGHLDPLGDQFREVIASTCAVVYPSASEGCSGAVVLCLQHGLFPLVSEITGLEIHDAWPPLIGSNDRALIDNIRRRCTEIAEMSDQKLDSLRQFFWDYAQKHHSRTAYSNSLSVVLDELLNIQS